jgi:hypothetical protein
MANATLLFIVAACNNDPLSLTQNGIHDLSTPAVEGDLGHDDLATSPDMTLTCGMQGQSCTVGQGACKRTGEVLCTTEGTAICTANPGTPDTRWHESAAPNGSWDWNCNGTIEFKYPSESTIAPPKMPSDCELRTTFVACLQDNWYYNSVQLPSCGRLVANRICAWSPSTMTCENNSGTQSATQECR